MKNIPNKQWFAKMPGFKQLKISLFAFPKQVRDRSLPTRLLAYFTLLLLCSLPVAAVLGQTDTCYVMKQDASGFDVASRWPALNAKACELIAAFDSTDYADSFKVFGFGFYAELEYYDGYSYPQAFLDMKVEVEQESPYYLLIGRQSDRTGVFTKFWVEVKLPEGGGFSCLFEFDRVVLNYNLEVAVNSEYDKYNTPSSFAQAEIVGMDTLFLYIEKHLTCCQSRAKNLCGSCYSSAEAIAGLTFLGFKQKEEMIKQDSNLPSDENDIEDFANPTIDVDGQLQLSIDFKKS